MKYLCLIAWMMIATQVMAAPAFDPFDDGSIVLAYEEGYLSVHATEVPMAVLLERVAKETGTNMVVQGELTEKVTLHLNRMSAEGVLHRLCQTFHLHAERHEGFLWVGASKGDVVTQTRVFPLHYGDAKALQAVFAEQHGVLSDAGSVRVDERTNALVVTDDVMHLAQAEALLARLDVPMKQVFIQARILNASKGFSQALGVRFTSGGAGMPEQSEVFQLTIGTLPGNIPLDAHITAAEKNHETDVIAMPKILTADQQKAMIKQGKELAYEETATSGATSVRFKEAVLELSVTPHITPDADIILELNVKHDVIGKLAENGQPTIDTQAIDTQVRLHDGETIVLGGIYSNTRLKQHQGVPLLSKIPLVGMLFKERHEEDEKNELLVFVTPNIVE